MSIKQQLSGMLVILALLFTSSALFAQVKIGTNPTTINAANNLEVEASTAGRVTSVNKTTGQVTIKDGTEGLNRVLTSDANGAASWTTGTSAFRALRNTTQGITSSLSVYYNINLNSTVLDEDGGITLGAASKYTVSKSGTYIISGGITFNPNANSGCSIALFKNGIVLKVASGAFAASTANALDISVIDIAVAGDIYELRANNNTGGMFVSSGDLSGTRIK